MKYREIQHLLCLFFVLCLFNTSSASITPYYVIESISQSQIVLKFDFGNRYSLRDTLFNNQQWHYFSGNFSSMRKPGEPWVPQEFIPIGIPANGKISTQITDVEKTEQANVFLLPYPEDNARIANGIQAFDKDVYTRNASFPSNIISVQKPVQSRFLTVAQIGISPYQYNPVTHTLFYVQRFRLIISIQGNESVTPGIPDPTTLQMASTLVINPQQAIQWIGSQRAEVRKQTALNSWFTGNEKFAKIYFITHGVIKVGYDALTRSGFNSQQNLFANLRLYIQEKEVPVRITDKNGNGIFEPEDYFTFVGLPLPASEYCTQNIYNKTNVAFLSFTAKSSEPKRYKTVQATSNISATAQNNYLRTDFYEKDQVFERLGHAQDAKRDFWFWYYADAMNMQPGRKFVVTFNQLKDMVPDSHRVTLKVMLHGMTNYYCDYDHHAIVKINGKNVGEARWNGQTEFLLETQFYVSNDSIPNLASGNTIEVYTDGKTCNPQSGDDMRINWFSLSYYSQLKPKDNLLNFTINEAAPQAKRFITTSWSNDSVEFYSPENGKWFTGIATITGEFSFTDTISNHTSYFGLRQQQYGLPDSIESDIPSNLHSTAQGADYLIISHRAFTPIAERLKNFRSLHFPDKLLPHPRIAIVYVDDIYDEFSGGLQSPDAIKDFISYAFGNWQAPAPAYAVLIGDMSSDYRKILPGSRPNFIPSPNVMSYTYGIAASDNEYACINGDDVQPDLALGRISIETVAEGNIILDKLEQYPGDSGKAWKNRVLLFASGLSAADEKNYGFNNETEHLKVDYTDPAGALAKMVFHFPNKPSHLPYKGTTDSLISSINEGGVLLNYYGHGGGFQWDLFFADTAIFNLQNQNRMPLVLSVTCYTGHFDNYDIFGEEFNKVPGKGSIGFFGSSGLTNWESGRYINDLIFDEIFSQRNYISGKVFMNAKNRTPVNDWYANQIALLTYLGDPVLQLALPDKPDYSIAKSGIVISERTIQKGDTVSVTLNLKNYGTLTNDTILVCMTASNGNQSSPVFSKHIAAFANEKTLNSKWISDLTGNVQLKVSISVPGGREADSTDNEAAQQVTVADVDIPTPVWPLDGLTAQSSEMKFSMATVITSSGKTFFNQIQIDTAADFSNNYLLSPVFGDSSSSASWIARGLTPGVYFWRSRLTDSTVSGRWAATRVFTIGTSVGFGFAGKALQHLSFENLVFDNQILCLSYTANNSPAYLNTNSIGPAEKWNSIRISFRQNGQLCNVTTTVLGLNSVSSNWDTVLVKSGQVIDLASVASVYKMIKVSMELTSTLNTTGYPILIDTFAVNYTPLPELAMPASGIQLSTMQPLPGANLAGMVRLVNLSPFAADSVSVSGLIEGYESSRITETLRVPADSSLTVPFSLPIPATVKPQVLQNIGLTITRAKGDMYSFNNEYHFSTKAAKDSIRPLLRLLFDNVEAVNGDIVSSRPEIKLIVTDDNPIPLPKDNIYFNYNLNKVVVGSDSVTFTNGETPGSYIAIWKPVLQPGKQFFDLNVKDAGGNLYSDNNSYSVYVNVYEQNELVNVYNYPNPFTSATAFCFDLRGSIKPDEVQIKIFTVAGRNVKNIQAAGTSLKFDFNRITWDGRDEDGNQIANGVYLYKILAKYPGKTASFTGKIAKVQ